MASIRFERLSKRYADKSIIEGLDLAIRDGEFFTLLGPSGCGKSTALNLIAGLEAPSAGALYLDEARADHLPPAARDVAMVFQSYALYPHMSVFENIAFPLRVRRLPRAQIAREVHAVAAALGLDAVLAARPRALSGGQRQRVALGRALVRRPRVFLMDEPLSNLDARLRLEMREELKRLHETHGITTVYVTHDQEEAMVLSDRVAVMHAGRIEQVDTPLALYRTPATRFVAEFVGSPPINLLEGAALADAGLAPAQARDALIGIRPADVQVRAGGGAADALAARVEVLEPTGSDLWVVGHWQGGRIKGRAAPDEPLREGETASFHIPRECLHLFDPESGARRSDAA
ncbi:ABC transporter ATP-binding protein [Ectothiorhodospiraceae bacterium 2226]|nr:ABC transporter ATP-binding protein [Ectothiorhodospiraceae bacterium 2226]